MNKHYLLLPLIMASSTLVAMDMDINLMIMPQNSKSYFKNTLVINNPNNKTTMFLPMENILLLPSMLPKQTNINMKRPEDLKTLFIKNYDNAIFYIQLEQADNFNPSLYAIEYLLDNSIPTHIIFTGDVHNYAPKLAAFIENLSICTSQLLQKSKQQNSSPKTVLKADYESSGTQKASKSGNSAESWLHSFEPDISDNRVDQDPIGKIKHVLQEMTDDFNHTICQIMFKETNNSEESDNLNDDSDLLKSLESFQDNNALFEELVYQDTFLANPACATLSRNGTLEIELPESKSSLSSSEEKIKNVDIDTLCNFYKNRDYGFKCAVKQCGGVTSFTFQENSPKTGNSSKSSEEEQRATKCSKYSTEDLLDLFENFSPAHPDQLHELLQIDEDKSWK